MPIDIYTIEEVYKILSQYIPAKDKQEASDNIISYLVDVLDERDLSYLCADDKYLSNSLEQYNIEDIGDIDEFDNDDYTDED